jgi:VIT1/CCC1 family predicted Fe2+/Mn2+ transporter
MFVSQVYLHLRAGDGKSLVISLVMEVFKNGVQYLLKFLMWKESARG